MQSILREKLMDQTRKLEKVGEIYLTESHRFFAAYQLWLEAAQEDLASLRSPVSIIIQAEQSAVRAVLDGYLPDNIQASKSSRKINKAAAALSLEKIARTFHAKIEAIDQSLEESNEKLCQGVAILASKHPEFKRTLRPNQTSINRIWMMLSETAETIPVYNYLSAKLPQVDRNYLLLNIIQNIKSNAPTRPARKKRKSE